VSTPAARPGRKRLCAGFDIHGWRCNSKALPALALTCTALWAGQTGKGSQSTPSPTLRLNLKVLDAVSSHSD
jgi:hypothetical protein